MTTQTLAGKVALVTGGSKGLGREMVLAFAEHGADVVIASRKLDGCEEVAAEVRERFGRTALPVACNVGDWSACDELVDTAYAAFGRVDILVNNAGMSPLYPSLPEVSEALFDKVIGVNLKGPFRLASLVGARMAAADGGVILNISSIEAIRPEPLAIPYAAAKAGINNLTEGLAQTFGPKVRVNAIQPGAFLTEISLAWPQAVTDMVTAQVAQGRVGEPHEIVGAALYLVSDAASYTTGAVLRVDGGTR